MKIPFLIFLLIPTLAMSAPSVKDLTDVYDRQNVAIEAGDIDGIWTKELSVQKY